MYGKSLSNQISCCLQYPHCESLGTASLKVRKKEMILNYLTMGGGGGGGGGDEWERLS